MLNLIKLAVGARNVEDIAAAQAGRTQTGQPVAVGTRQFPKRAAELTAGGSLYWVVAGIASARQEIVDVREVRRDDGTRATAILVAPKLIAVVPRAVRPFQGWRYLTAADAPADLARGAAASGDALPAALARELAALCLI